jgi:hypothetical protein
MTIILGGSVLIVEPVLLSRLPEIRRTQEILKFLISVVLVSLLFLREDFIKLLLNRLSVVLVF